MSEMTSSSRLIADIDVFVLVEVNKDLSIEFKVHLKISRKSIDYYILIQPIYDILINNIIYSNFFSSIFLIFENFLDELFLISIYNSSSILF